MPAGWQDGDLGLFWWGSVRAASSLESPAGVGITVKRYQQGAASSSGTIFIGYRRLTTGDTTFAWTGSVGSSVDVLWGVDVIRGGHVTGDPFEAESGAPTEWADLNDPDPPSATPVSDHAMVWTVFIKSNDYTGIVAPTNYTLGGSISSTAGADGSAATAYRLLNGGAGVPQDPGAWDLAGGFSSDDGTVWTGVIQPIR